MKDNLAIYYREMYTSHSIMFILYRLGEDPHTWPGYTYLVDLLTHRSKV